MKICHLLLVVVWNVLPVALHADVVMDAAKQVAEIAQQEIDSERVVGMTIGVAQGDKTLHLKGYGLADIELKVPASEASVYRIGSITKMFTAVGILLLTEDGALSLNDPLTKFLPDYPVPGGKATVRQLLNHTSGIVSMTDLPDHMAGMRNDLNHEEVLARFMDKPLLFAPGERFRYCNSGHYLLGMIIEKVSGKTYEEFLQQRIFDPLKLSTTFYDRHIRLIPHRASGYAVWGENIVNAPFVSMSQPFSAGALASTAGDLLTWQRALATDRLLKPESRELMTTRSRLNDGRSPPYGLGCFVDKLDGKTVIRHGGSIPGFVTELAYYPESQLTVVVLMNSNRVTPKSIADRIARALHSHGL